MPQLETSVEEADRFRVAAERARAAYLEVALRVDAVDQVRRFAGKATDTEVDAHIDRVVAAEGGQGLHARIRLELAAYIAQRPAALLLDTSGDDAAESYTRLLELLNGR